MIKWEVNIWKDEHDIKSTDIHQIKNDFGEEEMYKNRPSSTILNKARTNTLQLNDRNRHTNKEIHRMVCETDDKEDSTLYCIVHLTNERGVKVYTSNNHIWHILKVL